MEALQESPPLHAVNPSPLTPFNRLFAAVYSCAILALLYRNITDLIRSTTIVSFFVTLTLLISNLVLAFMRVTSQAMRMRPICRKEFPENLEKVVKRSDFPGLDVFICTADPYKEPPMIVVNTALSVLAYDYPAEKLSVYVSDDGGSEFTLFAFMEAAKFAGHWLPFCRKNNIAERSPKAYFESNRRASTEDEKVKVLYENMKERAENSIARGKVTDECMMASSDKEREALGRWNDDNFTLQNHPTIIEVLLDNSRDRDKEGQLLPNLVYVSREKSNTSHHNFKAGALNVLLRVSAAFTNAPIILTLDCDMRSSDPQTPQRVLCYYSDPEIRSRVAYIQFPQEFRGINKNDTYAGELRRFFHIQTMGFDGLGGTNCLGTGAFFSRRAFFGDPSNLVPPEIPELGPDHVVDKPILSQEVLALAYKVAGCNYESRTSWGYKVGFRYGSLVEDFYTGFRLNCEGWKSMFCNPDKAAFLGDAPMSLIAMLNQQKRWAVGGLEVVFSEHSTLTYGIKNAGLLLALAYSNYSLWPMWSIPITIYAFLPQLALLNDVSIFPKVSDSWFRLYAFLFLGCCCQDCLLFLLSGGTFQRWWNDQRICYMRGLSCQLYGTIEYFLKSLGIFTSGFNVTSKVVDDDEQRKRYEKGVMEFGVHSPMFMPLATAALINLGSLVFGLLRVFRGSNLEELLMQTFIAGYGVLNCWPVYEAMLLRTDGGKLPAKTSILAAAVAWSLYLLASFFMK